MASPRCCGLGPQRGTKLPRRHWSPTRNRAAAQRRGPAFLPPSPFDFGPAADRAPPRRPPSLNGACRRLPRLAGAVFITHHRAFRLRSALGPARCWGGHCGPGCGLLCLTLPVGSVPCVCRWCGHRVSWMRSSSDEPDESVHEPPLSYAAVVSRVMCSAILAVHMMLLRLRGVATLAVVG